MYKCDLTSRDAGLTDEYKDDECDDGSPFFDLICVELLIDGRPHAVRPQIGVSGRHTARRPIACAGANKARGNGLAGRLHEWTSSMRFETRLDSTCRRRGLRYKRESQRAQPMRQALDRLGVGSAKSTCYAWMVRRFPPRVSKERLRMEAKARLSHKQ